MCGGILTAEELRDPKTASYDKWNTTSVQAVRATVAGYPEGSEERDLALKLLRGFLDWRKEQPDDYLPKRGLEYMYSNEYLKENYDYLLSHPLPSEDEPMKKHKEFEKALGEHYEQLREKYPSRIANLGDLQSMIKVQTHKLNAKRSLVERAAVWAAGNQLLAGQLIIASCWIGGAVVGLGLHYWLWPSSCSGGGIVEIIL